LTSNPDAPFTIPPILVAPLGYPIIHPESIHDIWDVYIKPSQERGDPQSIEERMLMAVLRSVHAGLDPNDQCSNPACQSARSATVVDLGKMGKVES